jgi:hypothetical protein
MRLLAGDQDAMQVCRNGHVITDLLHSYPELGLIHCDRCGAATIDQCLTCGSEIPGSVPLPETPPVGNRPAPQYCSGCGAAFPWTRKPASPPAQGPVANLERILRRLPLVVRQLRVRHGARPAFRVEDDHDLADLLRALLPLHFDEVRTEQRAPRYAVDNRTDFLLAPSGIAVVAKKVTPTRREKELLAEWREDVQYYEARSGCRQVLLAAFDPEAILPKPRQLEIAWAGLSETSQARALIAS